VTDHKPISHTQFVQEELNKRQERGEEKKNVKNTTKKEATH